MASIQDVDPVQLAERLRAARASARVTQEQAASHLGVARTTIVAIEKGERRLRMEELQSLASYYGSSCNAILRAERPVISFAPQFRMASGPAGAEADAAEAVRLLERLSATFADLARLVGFSMRSSYPPTVRLVRDQLIEQAEDTALSLRSQMGLGLSPIPDLQAVLESELGFRIFVRPLPSKISGVYGFSETAGPCVLLNALHPPQRRQVSLGHEAGHFMSTRDAVDVSIHDDDTTDSIAERFATRFGPALLMPAAALRRNFGEIVSSEGKFSPRHLIYLAHAFHVSLEGMCRRLETLRLVKRGTWDSLRRQGFGQREVAEVMGDSSVNEVTARPSRLNLLAAEAYECGLVSEGQLASMLGVDRSVVRGILDELAPFQASGGSDAG